jgi:hypothetical protein
MEKVSSAEERPLYLYVVASYLFSMEVNQHEVDGSFTPAGDLCKKMKRRTVIPSPNREGPCLVDPIYVVCGRGINATRTRTCIRQSHIG